MVASDVSSIAFLAGLYGFQLRQEGQIYCRYRAITTSEDYVKKVVIAWGRRFGEGSGKIPVKVAAIGWSPSATNTDRPMNLNYKIDDDHRFLELDIPLHDDSVSIRFDGSNFASVVTAKSRKGESVLIDLEGLVTLPAEKIADEPQYHERDLAFHVRTFAQEFIIGRSSFGGSRLAMP